MSEVKKRVVDIVMNRSPKEPASSRQFEKPFVRFQIEGDGHIVPRGTDSIAKAAEYIAQTGMSYMPSIVR